MCKENCPVIHSSSSFLPPLVLNLSVICWMGFPGGLVVKNPPVGAGDSDLIPGSGRSPGEGNGNRLQYSCLGYPMERGACRLQSMGSQRVRHD